ncbi:hypothetical protein [Variovorax sp. OAS795]|uniref:hypothetical protein n=1 Tax=Variovorax sp. OAS795 TaxID=3034231 RepID=UPI003398EF81
MAHPTSPVNAGRWMHGRPSRQARYWRASSAVDSQARYRSPFTSVMRHAICSSAAPALRSAASIACCSPLPTEYRSVRRLSGSCAWAAPSRHAIAGSENGPSVRPVRKNAAASPGISPKGLDASCSRPLSCSRSRSSSFSIESTPPISAASISPCASSASASTMAPAADACPSSSTRECGEGRRPRLRKARAAKAWPVPSWVAAWLRNGSGKATKKAQRAMSPA